MPLVSSQSVYVNANLELEIFPNGQKYNLLTIDEPVSFIRARLAEIEGYDNPDDLFPFRVFGDVTNNCNLRCPFCTNGQTWSAASSARMSSENLKKYCGLAPLLYEGSPLLLSCRMEPFLHPRFIDLIEEIPSEIRSRSMFTTNLTVRQMGRVVERLLKSGIGYFNISIDSLNEDTFDELRKNGRFDFYIDNMKKLSEEVERLNFRRLKVITVVVRQNIEEIPQLIRQVHRMFPYVEHDLRRPFGPYTSYIAPDEMDWAERSFIGDDEWNHLVESLDAAEMPYAGIEGSMQLRVYYNERITTAGWD
jgi:MoaA/NifB/PqqE/SkfB family radical SAM enzyme